MMRLRMEWILSYSVLLLLSSAVKAEMISKCAVNGTQVEFQCSRASWWYVNFVYYEGAVDTITLEAVMDGTNITSGDFTIDVIVCYSSYFEVHDAYLIVVDEQHGKVPLNVTLTPLNKTTLLVEWEDLPIYENITYEFALSIGQDYQETVEVTGALLLLNLEDQECQPFQVNISMPGNCDDVVITGSLLIDPPYPMPEAITTIALENKSIVLTWQQPDNIFMESEFTYNITALLVTTGHVLDQRTITLESLESPREVYNFTEVELCEEIRFTLTQAGDCREQQISTFLPIFPGPFVSEISVKVFFTENGDVGIVEITFQPPDLCEHQLDTGSYVLSFSDGKSSWSTAPERLSHTVTFSERTQFSRDRQYTATATVITSYGTVTSTQNFSTTSPKAKAILDDTRLAYEFHNDSVLHVSWDNPTNTLRDSFTYVVSVTVVSTGEMVEQPRTIAFGVHSTPHLDFQLSQYACEQVNISVHIFHSNASISRVVTPPAYPYQFQQNTTANPLIIDGRIKELEVTFTPPQLCDFQSASYIMRFTSGNETWSRDPVVITDTSQQVKEDIETGFTLNRNYTVTITVFMEHTTLTSSANFSFIQPTMTKGSLSPELWSGVGALAVMVVVVVCAFVCGMVLFLKLRKQRTEAKYSLKDKHLPTVTNPIYETGDDVYEELPDLDSDKTANKLVSDTAFTNVAPPLPSTRYDHLPALGKITAENGTTSTALTHTPKQDPMMLNIPPSESIGALSALSREDCYTIMSPAGTMTMMPRNRHSLPGSGSGVSAPAPDGELTLNCI
jgi:hypothetical protein